MILKKKLRRKKPAIILEKRSVYNTVAHVTNIQNRIYLIEDLGMNIFFHEWAISSESMMVSTDRR